ncbi:DNA-deoxyinosine glycosylase [Massilia antarctica]|uniref:DNA-deoxyinosine glycosylase n=1 Tax=Massilia antarctica TaxID=2765360 RepID=A0AA49A9E5_9BURK|nr:DNA-deoxyinosine glycosylase [Massilia antarctica]QPI50732.1 DNA-deoxyinosine glycosylase [Massilia antarctica]
MNEFLPSTPDADAAALKRCFAPVVDPHTRILVLGSLPGERSLAQQQYYGNRQNRFWTLMSELTGVDLVALDYDARLQALLAHGIGLWDVVAQATREGSLDSQIRGQVGNDLPGLVASLPLLTTIGFNGGTAARLGMKALGEQAARYRIVNLPSSSPAYTAPYTAKLAVWRTLCDTETPRPGVNNNA